MRAKICDDARLFADIFGNDSPGLRVLHARREIKAGRLDPADLAFLDVPSTSEHVRVTVHVCNREQRRDSLETALRVH